jgi:hypothetical protein
MKFRVYKSYNILKGFVRLYKNTLNIQKIYKKNNKRSCCV